MVPLLLLLLILSHLSNTTVATITLKQNGSRQYASTPGLFGMSFDDEMEYSVKLQVVPGDPTLCGASNHTVDWEYGSNVIVPDDGTPVAILAKRGDCQFEEKARIAMNLSPPGVVKFLIVYDSVEEGDLVAMSAIRPDGIDVGLLFISLNSGIDLMLRLMGQSETSKESGGIEVFLDSRSPWLPIYGDDQQEMVLTAIVGCFVLLLCMGSAFLCVQNGFIRMDGNALVLGPPEMGMGHNRDARLLTVEEVRGLPEVTYRCNVVTEKSQSEEDLSNKTDRDSSDSGLMESASKEKEEHDDGALMPDDNESAKTPHSFQFFENTFSCSVCLENFEDGEQLRRLPCKHCFHTECIVPWLTDRDPSCPLCKACVVIPPLLEEDDADEGNLIETTSPSWLCQWWRRLCRRTPSVESDETVREEDHLLLGSPLILDQRLPRLSTA